MNKENISKRLYINIKNRRKELGLSQEELAKRVGYKGRSMIAKIEAGKMDLQLSKVYKIADALEIGHKELLFGEKKTRTCMKKKEVLERLESLEEALTLPDNKFLQKLGMRAEKSECIDIHRVNYAKCVIRHILKKTR